MPVTPFHFGPGAGLHAASPRQVSFLAFCAANVFIDIESGYNLFRGASPIHGFLHTYVGATLATLAIVAMHWALLKAAGRWPVPDLFHWRALSRRQVAIGAALGAYTHIVLDSVMHADIRPLAPFSDGNALLGIVSWTVLHIVCALFGALGVLGLLIRKRMIGGAEHR